MLDTQEILGDRYKLKQQLGKNAGRQTWLAEDILSESKELVIVKLLAVSPQTDWQEIKLFEREAQVLANLNHPKIPQYIDYFSLDEQTSSGLLWFGLVQKYIPGISLQEMLNQRRIFYPPEVRSFAIQILEILIFLHELSPPVLHRDIKPSNLILGKDRKIYLVDFGAVQDKAKAEGVTFTVVGTNGYVPPEQLWGKAVPASDLYALGATLIHLLTGISPADLTQQMRIKFANTMLFSPGFSSWLEKLTTPAVEKRFNSAREALKALQEPVLVKKNYCTNKYSTINKPVNYGRLIFLSLSGFALSFFVVFGIVYTFVNSIDTVEQPQDRMK
ncbi:serine/threonine protein kinase [Phormidium sp. LEGE 05292]|uniref:serine/threonine protein kinase n=1 Tax=[Phormidium] sp. LEGE 05292 TaxID=767427 RepID=UPI00187EBD03|nr:serine/threonine-protein kinase [Phormidium sp. LEGE 05292]MBE9225522.1 serine/threonine protein kinase [Phormidium sp. LEGE 05292]